jgi:hypothetical protein
MERMTFLVRVVIPAFILSSCTMADIHLLGTDSVADQSGTISSTEATTITPASSEPMVEINGGENIPQQLTSNDSSSASPSSLSEAEASPLAGTPAQDSSPAHLWGEFVGVKTNWEEMKKKLVGELQEQERKTQEMQAKLQLIDHLAQHLDFTTKAYLQGQFALSVEFRIENQTRYAIKDLSITCEEIAPSGTSIQTHNETLYEIIPPQTQLTFPNIHFDSKHPQTQKLRCQITNFTVHNP